MDLFDVGEVGVAGFEPTAPRSQSECATKLRHTPWRRQVYAVGRAPCAAASPGCATRGISGSHAAAAFSSVGLAPHASAGSRGRSSMVEPQSSKLITRVRFSSPAPRAKAQVRGGFPDLGVRLSTPLEDLAGPVAQRRAWLILKKLIDQLDSSGDPLHEERDLSVEATALPLTVDAWSCDHLGRTVGEVASAWVGACIRAIGGPVTVPPATSPAWRLPAARPARGCRCRPRAVGPRPAPRGPRGGPGAAARGPPTHACRTGRRAR
jgi:hypothetical protein